MSYFITKIVKNFIIALIITLILVVATVVSVVCLTTKTVPVSNTQTESASTSAKAMCVMEGSSQRVLYQKNAQAKLPMASTTKIMTAITAIENCSNLDERFVISPKAVGIPGTSIYLRKDETLTMRELLYGLMLVSGNDASVAIGEQISGSAKDFVELMNKTAKKIGANSSHFDNTHGLDSQTHYTTAEDLARITSYAMENDTFREIVSTRNTKIVSGEGKTRYLKNKNRLLHSLEGCDGVKTGFTDDAGRCLVSSCERDGMRLVCVVLNCGPMFEESSALLEEGFNNYKLYDLSKFYSFKKALKVEESKEQFVKLGSDSEIYYPLSVRELDKLKFEYKLPNMLTAPVAKSQKVGEISIFLDNDLLFSKNIYTIEDVRSNTYWENLKNATSNW